MRPCRNSIPSKYEASSLDVVDVNITHYFLALIIIIKKVTFIIIDIIIIIYIVNFLVLKFTGGELLMMDSFVALAIFMSLFFKQGIESKLHKGD
jgi:hypothetical protein